jgi:hypothetical protein
MTEITLNHALKEWEIVIKALITGETIMLLRKGGIQETKGKFTLAKKQVLLYPTLEHQKPELLKENYRDQVQTVTSGWHPENVHISAWAEITDIFLVNQKDTLEKLEKYYIWTEEFISDKLKWQPNQPLYILLLRTYKLPQEILIPYKKEYGGCKSWIELEQTIEITNSPSVLPEQEYLQTVATIRKIINP